MNCIEMGFSKIKMHTPHLSLIIIILVWYGMNAGLSMGSKRCVGIYGTGPAIILMATTPPMAPLNSRFFFFLHFLFL